MIITIDKIKEHNPCKDGIYNFEYKYPNYKDTLLNLLQLQDVSYSNKIWLVTKVVDLKTLQQWSVECAELVVYNYNKEFPNDNRVNECIESVKLFIEGVIDKSAAWSAKSAAWSAARSARSVESARSARSVESARSAAWSAVWSARSASWSASWSAAWSAVESARSAAWSAGSAAEKEQEDLNLSILIALLDNDERYNPELR